MEWDTRRISRDVHIRNACGIESCSPPRPAGRKERDVDNEAVDKYGNPIGGDILIYCCFPDCGCEGARLCMAESGANFAACVLNVEHKVQPRHILTFDEKFLQECGIKKP